MTRCNCNNNNNNNNNKINNNCCIIIIIIIIYLFIYLFILLFKILTGTRKNFFEIYRKFGHAPSNNLPALHTIHSQLNSSTTSCR